MEVDLYTNGTIGDSKNQSLWPGGLYIQVFAKAGFTVYEVLRYSGKRDLTLYYANILLFIFYFFVCLVVFFLSYLNRSKNHNH